RLPATFAGEASVQLDEPRTDLLPDDREDTGGRGRAGRAEVPGDGGERAESSRAQLGGGQRHVAVHLGGGSGLRAGSQQLGGRAPRPREGYTCRRAPSEGPAS